MRKYLISFAKTELWIALGFGMLLGAFVGSAIVGVIESVRMACILLIVSSCKELIKLSR